MAISEKSRTTINATRFIDEVDDLYPYATTLYASGYGPYNASQIRRINPDDVPTTTQDMSEAFKWEHGDVLYGTYAKNSVPLSNHRRDINKAFGQQDSRKTVYIDTFLPDIGKRLKDGDL